MSWRDIRLLYLAELRSAFRERSVVINTVLIPVLLYPVLLWFLINGMLLVQGQSERVANRVVISDVPPEHDGLSQSIAAEPRLDIVDEPTASVEELINRGDLDAALRFETLPEEEGSFRAEVAFDSAREASALAGQRLLSLLEEHREQWLERRAASTLSHQEWERFTIESENVASGADMGAMLLGLVVPLYFVIMVAVGCQYPAVDTTAGEHERGTWETTLTLAASRTSVVCAKYLYVTTLGCIAGVLNLLAMMLTMTSVLAPLIAEEGADLSVRIPLSSLPLLLVGAILLAASVSAAMMIPALFARTFREGQAMVSPVYLVAFLPVVFLTREGLELSMTLAAIPVVNVAMLVREAIGGSVPWGPASLTVVVQLTLIAALLTLGIRLLRYEEVITGSYVGGPLRFLKDKWRGSRPAES